MQSHRFRAGQVVSYAPGAFEDGTTRGSYKVLRLLPAEANSNQYHVKSIRDGHERVVRESQLERIDASDEAVTFTEK